MKINEQTSYISYPIYNITCSEIHNNWYTIAGHDVEGRLKQQMWLNYGSYYKVSWIVPIFRSCGERYTRGLSGYIVTSGVWWDDLTITFAPGYFLYISRCIQTLYSETYSRIYSGSKYETRTLYYSHIYRGDKYSYYNGRSYAYRSLYA